MAAETEKDVKAGEASTPVTVDEKGVPWENRAKEYERKLEETRQELENIKSSLNHSVEAQGKSDDSEEQAKALLTDFVKNPKGFVHGVLGEVKQQEEQAQVIPWLQSQGFTAEDKSRMLEIEREYGIQSRSPLTQAKAVWKIYQEEKLRKEFGDLKSDKTREASVRQSMPEGSGKSAPTNTKPKRSDLLTQLKDAEKKGDSRKAASLINMLEDVRE